jgi:hypothetical protein
MHLAPGGRATVPVASSRRLADWQCNQNNTQFGESSECRNAFGGKSEQTRTARLAVLPKAPAESVALPNDNCIVPAQSSGAALRPLGRLRGLWNLAKVREVCYAFSGHFIQFSISHRVQNSCLMVCRLLLLEPQQVACGRTGRLILAPERRSLEGLGAAVTESTGSVGVALG